MPTKRNSSSLHSNSQDPSALELSPVAMSKMKNKKLRRLPHVFSKVLELPMSSDADVSVEESPECFRFVAKDGFLGRMEVRAQMVELHPGLKKVVVVSSNRSFGSGNVGLFLIDEMKLDMWRFRLPANASPEAAKAFPSGGDLFVTVPKSAGVANTATLVPRRS